MNSNVSFVQSWFTDNEKILSYVEDVLLTAKGWGEVGDLRRDEHTPPWSGGLVLTNRRLIVILYSNAPERPPRWYSVTSIAGLLERPPGYLAGWPYQATLTLYSGVQLVCETRKDKPEERGRELSRELFPNN